MPAGSVKIESVEIDGKPYTNFDAFGLFVRLPESKDRVQVKERGALTVKGAARPVEAWEIVGLAGS